MPLSIAFDREGQMYVSSRFDGTVYRVAPNGTMSSYAEGMGVATGMAFDKARTCTSATAAAPFSRSRAIARFLFSLQSSPAFPPTIWRSGPRETCSSPAPRPSSFDSVYRIDPHGAVSVFYRGLGRPQGMAFDREGNLYVAASLGGKRGIVKIAPDGKASLAVAGPGLVGLAFAPGRSAILASTSAVYHLAWDTSGQPLLDLT